MFLTQRPNNNAIAEFLIRAADTEFTYAAVGATDETAPPSGYVTDHSRIKLGRDEHAWEGAKQAVREWKMFDFGWVDIFSKNTQIETGQNVAVLINHFGFHSLNAARIVYTIDEPDRFGFAYGTLEDHSESGEERFLVERDSDDNVWYDLKAFSRPSHSLAKIGYPLVRMLQKRFGRDSKQAMFRAVVNFQ